MEEITYYQGQISPSTVYLYDPESQRLIEKVKSNQGDCVRTKINFKNKYKDLGSINETYLKYGKEVKVSKSEFNDLFEKCSKIKDLEKKTLDLNKKLFK